MLPCPCVGGISHRYHPSHMTSKISQGHRAGQGQSESYWFQPYLGSATCNFKANLGLAQRVQMELPSILLRIHSQHTQTARSVQTSPKCLASQSHRVHHGVGSGPSVQASIKVLPWGHQEPVRLFDQSTRAAISVEMIPEPIRFFKASDVRALAVLPLPFS